MDNPTFQKIRDLISQNDKITIVVGQNQTLDNMAGVLSLVLALERVGKQVTVASPTVPLVEVSTLVGIDKVKTNMQGGNDLIASFPYKEGEIEKVSYTLEDGFLNIVVKAGKDGLSFSESEIKYTRGGGFPKLLFVIGTPRLSDLGKLFDAEGLKDTTVVNIDNSTQNQGFGDIVLVSPNFSSVCEQIATLLSSLPLEIDQDSAQNLLSGISFATDNFQHQNTSTVAFEMAAMLMKKGAKRNVAVRDGGVTTPAYDPLFGPRPSLKQPEPQYPSGPLEETEFEKKTEKKDEEKKKASSTQAPPDWLTPKIYKGSTLV